MTFVVTAVNMLALKFLAVIEMMKHCCRPVFGAPDTMPHTAQFLLEMGRHVEIIVIYQQYRYYRYRIDVFNVGFRCIVSYR